MNPAKIPFTPRVPWIQLADGRPFEPSNPKPEDISIEVIAKALSHICRFGGHTNRFYSVAEHSIHVANLLPDELKIYGLLHDAHEAYTGYGDICSPVKPTSLGVVERIIDLAIARAFNLEAYKFYIDEVKQADLKMLHTEKVGILQPCDRDWDLELPAPELRLRLDKLNGDPVVAETNFLNLWRNLRNGK